jgi:hypothetical protein
MIEESVINGRKDCSKCSKMGINEYISEKLTYVFMV